MCFIGSERLAEAHVREAEAVAREELADKAEEAKGKVQRVEAQTAQEIEKLESERASILHQLNQLEGEMKEREKTVQEKFSAYEVNITQCTG